MPWRYGKWYPDPPKRKAEPLVTYTPGGVPRQPGYNKPALPRNSGRPGETKREMNNGQGGSLPGWDYDRGAPMEGAVLGPDGFYVLEGGGGGAGGGALTGSPYYQQVLAAVNAGAAGGAAAPRKQGPPGEVGVG